MGRVYLLTVLLTYILLTTDNSNAAEFYVAVNGSPSGNGSTSSPWDLQTAFNQPSAVHAGDTIWLRGGIYTGPFRSFLNGTSGSKILVKSFGTERAVLNNPQTSVLPGWSPGASPTLFVSGSHTRYERLTITNSSSQRTWGPEYSAQVGGCYPNCRGDGFTDMGQGNQFIHNVISNTGLGMTSHGSAGNGSVYYGNIFHYAGWEETGSNAPNTTGRGNTFYTQNDCAGGRKTFENNIDFWSYTVSAQIYGSSGAKVECIDFIGNIIFDSGRIGGDTLGGGLLLGGNAGASDLHIQHNTIVNNVDCNIRPRFNALRPAYLIAPTNIDISNNYMKGCNAMAYTDNLPGLTHSGNVWAGGLGDNASAAQAQFAGDTFLTYGGDTQTRHTERWSSYDSTWGYLAVINNQLAANFSWTPSQCANGERIQLRDIMNYLGDPQQTITCNGSAQSIAMDYTGPIITPVGAVANQPVHPGRKFRVFLLTKLPVDSTAPSPPTGLRIES